MVLEPAIENSLTYIYTPSNSCNKIDHFKFLNPLSSNTTTLEKVRTVAKFALNLLIGASLFWTNPSLFAIGYLTGIILDSQTEKGIAKVNRILKSEPFSSLCLIGLGSLLSLPVTLAAGSILWSASLGSSMSLKANI